MEELLAYLNIQCARARELLNSHYKNDSGQSLEDWAKGGLTAYTEVRSFVEKMNKEPQETLVKLKEKDYNEADGDEETRPKQEQAQA